MVGTEEDDDGVGIQAKDDLLHHESVDFFDAMEVIYYDELLCPESPSSASAPSTPSDGERGDSEIFDFAEEFIDDDNDGNADDIVQGRVRRNRKRLHGLAREKRRALEENIRSRRQRINQIMARPDFVMTVDKISFVWGVLIIMVIEAVLLVSPGSMGTLYTTLLIPLMVARYIIYRQVRHCAGLVLTAFDVYS